MRNRDAFKSFCTQNNIPFSDSGNAVYYGLHCAEKECQTLRDKHKFLLAEVIKLRKQGILNTAFSFYLTLKQLVAESIEAYDNPAEGKKHLKQWQ